MTTEARRRCQGCRRTLRRPTAYYLSERDWQRRKYCSKGCLDESLRARNRARGAVPIAELPIPESARRVATWAGVPARCWKCETGLWRPITGGVACLQCGMDCYVAAELVGR